jgi:hypothetical protein
MRNVLMVLCALQILSGSEYILTEGKRAWSKIDEMPKNKIADMSKIPQDPAFYANQLEALPMSRQLELDKEYDEKFFKPWKLNRIEKPLDELEWPFRSVRKEKIFDGAGTVIPSFVYEQWIDNAQFELLDTVHRQGITTRHVDVRALPTARPFYRDASKTGEGFPFDYNQNSSYHINTPLYISHYSKDRRWVFVRGSTAYGWVEASGIAVVDKSFMERFENGHYAVVIRDNIKLYQDGKALTIVKIGAIFPMIKTNVKTSDNNSTALGYLIAQRNLDGKAILQSASVAKSGLLVKKPLAFTPKNVAMIARQFYNEPYGWGGLLQTRDCSSTTKDYFAVFGIYLRRNSSEQAMDGCVTPIGSLNKNAKKQMIIGNAKPFRSLLFVPGHIVLYLGQYKGEPVIMHTYWGTRLTDGSKHVLARTVVTTTEPGKELDQIKESSKLANTLKKIITFGE